uniref:HORMA domain-containing protein n=1 Tax=Eucampia antarctica TaxID=49252 RepID=A0A7S2R2B9_9STRA|mmetsp:Transcript_14621/g.14094  ORF Transcript_14621/g.14094 Transcript_14621/m.14094 type:complete len:227 (+) Transcript_14621:129-809(+)|eukprot:CAMPEP_0197832662 /NCGR_PEP_ID=MMETSP1437-20131217/15434_1 /TAXON_ID=49252 ORGANISM="Eucampia antarctica, Strain CCMP1452" /NCGR_SAMPLE_ID=MMETSP1437 /ASSEMBLY_ACC=CAM_ASM_001096 /LENGTH=226 /DNA_ID=CAMNT_0043436131 /DNA_START=113 /DNA_END=793 /DNA_ORIENTATION=+
MSSAVENQTVITLKGSVAIVSEFFNTAINSILYQRGIYQPETFKRESKYGLTVLTSTDEGLNSYLNQVMSQMETWLIDGNVQRLVVVVTGLDSGETLERWQFNVSVDGDETKGASDNSQPGDENSSGVSNVTTNKSGKSIKQIHNEIQAIIRQITASVTFLPLLNEPCSFDLLVYADMDAVVPKKWQDSDPQYIMNSQEVKLRSFTTSVHKVESMVTYKEADEWEL